MLEHVMIDETDLYGWLIGRKAMSNHHVVRSEIEATLVHIANMMAEETQKKMNIKEGNGMVSKNGEEDA